MILGAWDGKSQDDAHAAGHVPKGLGVDNFAVGEQPLPSGLSGRSHRNTAGWLLAPRLQVLWPLSAALPPAPQCHL